MSEILNIAHDMAKDLFKVGAMDEITVREIDALCLPPKRLFRPEDIRRYSRGQPCQPSGICGNHGYWKNNGATVGTGTKKPKRHGATPSRHH